MLPKSCILSDSLLVVGPPSASGCVYEGTFRGSEVQVRRIRFHLGGDSQKVREVRPQHHVLSVLRRRVNPQTFHHAVAVWKHLAQRTIVPLLCVLHTK